MQICDLLSNTRHIPRLKKSS